MCKYLKASNLIKPARKQAMSTSWISTIFLVIDKSEMENQ